MIKSAEIKCFLVTANLIFYHVFTKSNKLGRHVPPPIAASQLNKEVVVRALRISCTVLRDSSCNDYLLEQMRSTDEPDISVAKPKTDSHFSSLSGYLFCRKPILKTTKNLSRILTGYCSKCSERLCTLTRYPSK